VGTSTCECAKVEGIEVWTERNTRDVLTAGVEDVEEWRRCLDVHLPRRHGCGNRGPGLGSVGCRVSPSANPERMILSYAVIYCYFVPSE
jgi:hypothetical protein